MNILTYFNSGAQTTSMGLKRHQSLIKALFSGIAAYLLYILSFRAFLALFDIKVFLEVVTYLPQLLVYLLAGSLLASWDGDNDYSRNPLLALLAGFVATLPVIFKAVIHLPLLEIRALLATILSLGLPLLLAGGGFVVGSFLLDYFADD